MLPLPPETVEHIRQAWIAQPGLSVYALAKSLDMKESTVRRYIARFRNEAGRVPPSPPRAVPTDDLYDEPLGVPNPSPFVAPPPPSVMAAPDRGDEPADDDDDRPRMPPPYLTRSRLMFASDDWPDEDDGSDGGDGGVGRPDLPSMGDLPVPYGLDGSGPLVLELTVQVPIEHVALYNAMRLDGYPGTFNDWLIESVDLHWSPKVRLAMVRVPTRRELHALPPTDAAAEG